MKRNMRFKRFSVVNEEWWERSFTGWDYRSKESVFWVSKTPLRQIPAHDLPEDYILDDWEKEDDVFFTFNKSQHKLCADDIYNLDSFLVIDTPILPNGAKIASDGYNFITTDTIDGEVELVEVIVGYENDIKSEFNEISYTKPTGYNVTERKNKDYGWDD